MQAASPHNCECDSTATSFTGGRPCAPHVAGITGIRGIGGGRGKPGLAAGAVGLAGLALTKACCTCT